MKTSKTDVIAGIDIGGTKCAVSLARYHGERIVFLKKIRMPTERENPGRAIEHFISQIAHMLEESSDCHLKAIGISCGGPLNAETGMIEAPPNLPDWNHVDIYTPLKNAFHVPVHMENDADACAVAEWKYGSGKGTRNMVFLTFGTGMGAGLILNGSLYRGNNGLAGEVGHVRLAEDGPMGYGKAGSFEGFCSGGGIADLGKKIAQNKIACGECPAYWQPEGGITAQKIFESAALGDKTACEVVQIAGKFLGKGLAMLIDILNPEMIVIGSIYARQTEVLNQWMLPELRREALPASMEACRIVPAALGEQIGDYAAVAVGMQILQKAR